MTDAKGAVQKCSACKCKSNDLNSHLRTCKCLRSHICKNEHLGCNFHDETGLAEHEKICRFNVVDCEFCDRSIFVNDEKKHTSACKVEKVVLYCVICQQYFEKRPEYIGHFVKCIEAADKYDYYVEHYGEEFVRNAVRKADKQPNSCVFGLYDCKHYMPKKYKFDETKYRDALETVKVRYILNRLIDLIPDKE